MNDEYVDVLGDMRKKVVAGRNMFLSKREIKQWRNEEIRNINQRFTLRTDSIDNELRNLFCGEIDRVFELCSVRLQAHSDKVLNVMITVNNLPDIAIFALREVGNFIDARCKNIRIGIDSFKNFDVKRDDIKIVNVSMLGDDDYEITFSIGKSKFKFRGFTLNTPEIFSKVLEFVAQVSKEHERF